MPELVRRFSRVLIAALAAVLTLAVGVAVLLVLLAAQGQLSLTLLTPYLQEALSNQLEGVNVVIEDTALSWNSEADRVDLQALRVKLTAPDGEPILEVPQLSVTLSATGLLGGNVEVIKAAAIRPHLGLLRDSAGSIFLTDPSAGRRWPLLTAAAATEQPAISLRGLKHVAVVDASLTFRDEATAVAVTAQGATVELSLEDGETTGRLTARLQFADSETAVGAAIRYPGKDQPTSLRVRFEDLDVAALGRLLKDVGLSDLQSVATTVAGDVDLEIPPAGGAPEITFDLSAGPGSMDLPDFFDGLRPFEAAQLQGRFSAASRNVSLSRLSLSLPDDVKAEFAGDISRTEAGMGVKGKLQVARLPTAGIIRYWPRNVGEGAREWVDTNLRDGEVRDIELAFDLTPEQLASGDLPASSVLLTWSFSGLTSGYLEGLPPLRRGQGRGRLDAKTFHLDVDQAAVAGNLSVTEGTLDIADLLAETPVLDIAFVTRGPARSALEILDKPKLDLASAIGIEPKKVSGLSATATRLRIPLLDDITLKDVAFSAASTLSDVALSGFWQGRDLTNGQVTLRADVNELKLEGTVLAGSLPLQFGWHRDLANRATLDTLTLQGYFTVGELRELGIDASGYVDGSVAIETTLTIDPNAGYRGAVEVDLANAQFSLPPLGISKEKGAPAMLALQLVLADSGAVGVPEFKLRSPVLEASGDLEVAAGGKLRRFRASRVASGASLFAADLVLAEGGGIALTVTGETLDLRSAGIGVSSFGENAGSKGYELPDDLSLKANLKRLYLSDGLSIDSAAVQARRAAGRWSYIDFVGRLDGVANARLLLRSDGRLQRLTFASSEAGAALRALGIYDRMSGGSLVMRANIEPGADGGETTSGVLRVDDFTLVDTPVLAQILTLGSLTGISDTLRGKGIGFSRLELPFTIQGDIIESDRIRAIGPAIGITGKLRYDQAAETVTANGTLVPAYTINSVLGRIPLIGTILVGREDEGVFAVTFQVDGSIDQPRVVVNPLSALAPGFLRRIIEGLERPAAAPDDDVKFDMPGVSDQKP